VSGNKSICRRALRLRRPDLHFVVDLLERPHNGQRRRFPGEPDLSPRESQNFSAAHPGRAGERHRHPERRPLKKLEQADELVFIQHAHLGLRRLRRVDRVYGILREDILPHGLVERFMQHAVVVVDRPGREPASPVAAPVLKRRRLGFADLERLQLPEDLRSDRRDPVTANDFLVSIPGFR